jgi:hypothetical protein
MHLVYASLYIHAVRIQHACANVRIFLTEEKAPRSPPWRVQFDHFADSRIHAATGESVLAIDSSSGLKRTDKG